MLSSVNFVNLFRRFLEGGVAVVFVALLSVHVAAEDEAPAEEVEGGAPSSAIYLPIKPPFVVNYGGAGRLKYIKTELSVRLADTSAANSVRHHLPFIRNNLVMLFASQTDETMSSQEGREALRKAVLQEIKTIIEREDGGSEGIIDVYFNSFIVQR